MTWSAAEPAPGQFNEAYFASLRAEIAGFRAAGLQVVLNYGMDDAPAWLLALPGGRFVNQSGQTYTGADQPNLVWSTGLRPYAEAFTAKVFSELGTNFLAVRVGAGYWGELGYPWTTHASGRIQNNYWAFDPNALVSDPVSGWKPGQPSPHGEATIFLNWYLNQMVNFQNWQIATVRASYPGTIAVLYPSWGIRSGDFQAAVADNLGGRSSAEINGEVQRGYDYARQIGAITDSHVAVWGTWADNEGTMAYLSGLAKNKALPLMGENDGGAISPAAMQALIYDVQNYGATMMMWVRADNLFSGQAGDAGPGDLARAVAATAKS